MPIKFENAPAPSFEELITNMTNINADPNDHSSHMPHKVFIISIEDVLSGKRLTEAEHVAWRYVFRGDDQSSHVAEVSVDAANDSHTFHHINHGRHVDGFIKLIEQINDHTYAHKNSIVLEKEYEVSLLRIPRCYVMAVWFKGADHEHEFLVPLAPVHSNFEAGRHYEPDEFMDLLEVTAREMTANPAVVQHDVIDEAVGEATAVSEDDLTQLLGIDARTAAILNEMGLMRFADVARADPGQLMEILAEAGSEYRFDDPEILLEQAKLAAGGDWRKLRGFQAMLRRRYGLNE